MIKKLRMVQFGKGTSPVDGMSLAAAVIHKFAVKKARVLMSLHFHEVRGVIRILW